MALLVPDSGELQSLRYLVNSNKNVPSNLILKLFSSNTTPSEGSSPGQTVFYEPYDGSGSIGYGATPDNGYPSVINNSKDRDYSNQYGILLNGSLWNVRTFTTPIVSTTGTGTINEYTIIVSSTKDIAVGHYVSGTGVGPSATVCAIDGNTIVLSVPNASSFSDVVLDFGQGTTTASYPEQTFTFTGPANNQYGYYLSRANNMPLEIHGVLDTSVVSSNPGIAKTGIIGVVGDNYVTLYQEFFNPVSQGNSGEFEILVASSVGITTGQRVEGIGIPQGAKVVGTSGTSVYLDKPNTSTVSGIVTFYSDVTKDITVGMGVTHTFVPGETSAFQQNTKVTGIDENELKVYLDKVLVNNIQFSIGPVITFSSNKITTPVSHNLVPGDVIYIAAGTGNTSTSSSTYTIFETPTETTFTTTPSIDYTSGIGTVTLYSSVFFAERFTNGPYNVQNDGDQIKVTLNVSLD